MERLDLNATPHTREINAVLLVELWRGRNFTKWQSAVCGGIAEDVAEHENYTCLEGGPRLEKSREK